jgi:hypothetical protein
MVNDSALWSTILRYGQRFCAMVNDSALWSTILRYGQRFCDIVIDSARWLMIIRAWAKSQDHGNESLLNPNFMKNNNSVRTSWLHI